MNLKPQRRESPEINLAPLIDVVFLLLIFFMVSTTFKREHTPLKVDLPQASAKKEAMPPKSVELTINREGQYYIGNRKVINSKVSTLVRALSKATGGDTRRPLVIRADARTEHQYVVRAMDAARQLGIVNLSIATVRAKEE